MPYKMHTTLHYLYCHMLCSGDCGRACLLHDIPVAAAALPVGTSIHTSVPKAHHTAAQTASSAGHNHGQ